MIEHNGHRIVDAEARARAGRTYARLHADGQLLSAAGQWALEALEASREPATRGVWLSRSRQLDAAAGRKFRAAARVLRNAGITLAT